MDETKPGTVLAWTRFRLVCSASAIEHRVPFFPCYGSESLRVAFAVELDVLVVAKQLVLLLLLVDLALVRDQFAFIAFKGYSAVHLLHKLIDFFRRHLGLIDDESTLLAELAQSGDDFFRASFAPFGLLDAHCSPLLSFDSLRDWHVIVRRRFADA